MEFMCKIDKHDFLLKLTSGKLTISNETFHYQCETSLKTRIKWLVHDKNIYGFQIDDFSVTAETKNLCRLKRLLGGSVIYYGIKNFYSFKDTLSASKKGQTKVCSLIHKSYNEIFACKCVTKTERDMNLILNEIYFLLSLQNQTFVPQIYEIYESKKKMYIVMEYIERRLEYHIAEDQMKLVIYNLFKVVQDLEDLKIAHKNISRSHVLLDDDLNVKLIGFSQAKESQVALYEFRLDIFKIASILYKYYQRQNKESFPLLKELLNQQNLYISNITLALQDPYFQIIRNEGIQQEIKSMHPKFKKQISDDVTLQQSLLAAQLSV